MINQANSPQRLADEKPPGDGAERLRVLIADHDGLARSMMRAALGDTAVVFTAGDSREALQLARYYHPTVVIIDTALPPDGGSVELIGQVLATAPETRILTVSVDDQPRVLAGLRAGAVGHIAKDTDPGNLASLITRAAEGDTVVPQPLIRPLLELVREVPDAGWRPLHSRLTTREWEIVELLGEGGHHPPNRRPPGARTDHRLQPHQERAAKARRPLAPRSVSRRAPTTPDRSLEPKTPTNPLRASSTDYSQEVIGDPTLTADGEKDPHLGCGQFLPIFRGHQQNLGPNRVQPTAIDGRVLLTAIDSKVAPRKVKSHKVGARRTEGPTGLGGWPMDWPPTTVLSPGFTAGGG